MILQVILEGIGLGVLLILVCAIGIRKGAVGMVHLYSQEVQERCVTLGLTTHAKIKRNAPCRRKFSRERAAFRVSRPPSPRSPR